MNKLSKIVIILILLLILAVLSVNAYFNNQNKVFQAPITNVILIQNSSQKGVAAVPLSSSGKPISYTLVIDKLKINAPIALNIDGNNKEAYMKALESGVAHLKKTAFPGEAGNSVIFGHSSYYIFKPGNFKSVFTKLDQLNIGDIISISSNNKKINYSVTEKKIVNPLDVYVVNQDKNEQILTLITCWPPKTIDKRYIVTAQLVK